MMNNEAVAMELLKIIDTKDSIDKDKLVEKYFEILEKLNNHEREERRKNVDELFAKLDELKNMHKGEDDE